MTIGSTKIADFEVTEVPKDNEEKYRSLFANMLNGLAFCKMLFDKEGQPVDFVYLEVNDAFEKLTGLKRDSVIGRKASEAIPGIRKANPELFEIYGKVSKTGKQKKFEIFVEPLKIWLSILVYSPKKGYFTAVFENITQRKKNEQELRESEERFRTIFEGASEGILVTILKTNRFIYANSAMCNLSGYPLQELIALGIEDIHPKKELPHVIDQFSKLAKEKIVVVQDIPVLRKDGHIIHCDVSGKIFIFEDEQCIVSFFRDITDRRKVERELNEIKAFNESIIDSISEALLVIDPVNYKILLANNEACKDSKIAKEDLIGRTCYEISHNTTSPCVAPHICPLREVLATGETTRVEHLHFDKHQNPIHVEITVYPVKDIKGKIGRIIQIARNITERKKNEQL